MGRPKGSINKIDRGVYLNCTVCGDSFRVKPSHVQLRETCSRKCQTIRFRKYTGRDYKRVAINGSSPREHRVIAERALGKPLPPNAVVHHFDGGKSGGQLVICQDRTYHALLHARQRAYEATGDANKKLCPYCHKYDDKDKMVSYPSSPRRFVHRECANKS